jgi:Acetyltransferase (GNAT) domain
MILGRMRQLREGDIGQAAHLHQEVFGIADDEDIADRYTRYFMSTFLCSGRQFDSIVYEEDDGRITGFLGVVTREFTMEGKRIRGALSSQLVVHPEARRRLIGLELIRQFLLGPRTSPSQTRPTKSREKCGKGWEDPCRRCISRTGARPSVLLDSFCRTCLCQGYPRNSMLVHSRDPKIIDAIHSGKAFLSRLDGEWRVRFSHARLSPAARTQVARRSV